jgi:polyferredoxin
MLLPWQLLADLVLGVHVGIVVFVVGGLVAIVVGNLAGWRRVNALGFRLAHLVAIGFVAVQAWLGATCPLTSLEMWLRRQARAASYDGSFIEHWLQRLLYYDAPGWVFTAGYTLFGLLVVATWWWLPPTARRPRREPMPMVPGRHNARDGGGAA